MAGNNPIDFNDLFNFNDQSTIEKGINGVNLLKKTYTDFFNSVIGGQLQRLTEQEIQLTSVNEQLLKSTLQLSVANKQNQKALLDNLQAADKLKSQLDKLKQSRQDAKNTDAVARDAVKSLTQQYADLKRAYEAAFTSANHEKAQQIAKDARQIDSDIKTMNNTLRSTKQVFTAAAGSYAALDAENKRLIVSLKNMPEGLAKGNKEAAALEKQIFNNTARLKEFDASINQNFRNVGNYKSALSGLGNQFSQFALGYLSIQAGFALLGSIFKGNEAVGESLALVRQKASLTAEETDKLEESLKRIKTSTSLDDLAKIAAIGARRGIGKDDLAGFAEGLDLVSRALGNQIAGGAEGVATALTKINSLFGISNQFGVKEGIIKTGSALATLGKFSITTSENLQDFATRTAGVAQVFKLSLPQVLAYGSAFQEAGVEAEKSGTAFNKLLLLLAGKKEKYFAIAQLGDAKLTLKDFTDLINTDADAALKKFFVGLTSGNATATEMATRLKDLGLKAGDVTRSVIGLAQNQGKLVTATNLVTESFKTGSEALSENAISQDTLSAHTDLFLKKFTNATTSGAISNFFKQIVDGAGNAVDALNKLFNSRSASELFARIFSFDASNFDSLNSVSDNTQATQKKHDELLKKNPLTGNGYPENVGNDPEKIKALLKEYKTAADDAFASYNQYARAVKKGDVEDGGPINLSKSLKNAKDLEYSYNKIREAYVRARDAVKVKPPASSSGTKELGDGDLRSIPEIQKRIKELTDQPDSAVKGSVTNERIIALRERLKELHGTVKSTKDGFAELQAEIDKLGKKIQDRFLKGEKVGENDPTVKLYRKEVAKLNAAKEAYENLMRGSTFQPLPGRPDAGDINSAAKDLNAQQVKLDYKKDAEDAEKSLDEIATKYAIYNKDILEQYKAATIDKDDYNHLQLKSVIDQQNEEYFATKVALNARLQLSKEGSLEQLRLLKQVADLDKKHAEEQIKNAEEVEVARIKGIKEVFQEFNRSLPAIAKGVGNGYAEIFKTLSKGVEDFAVKQKLSLTDAFELAGGLADGFTQNFIDGSNQRIAQLGVERDNSLVIAGGNAAAKRAIEKKYNDEVAAEKTKQAKAEKLDALFRIALNTAIGITSALASLPPNVPLSIAIGILGAAEFAVAAAKPIPKYYKGRTGGPEEFAVVNDRGTELLEHEGKFRIAGGGKETVTRLKKGEKVHTADRSAEILRQQFDGGNDANQFVDSLIRGTDIVRNYEHQKTDKLIKSLLSKSVSADQMERAFTRAINQRPVRETVIDADGWREFEVTSNSRIQKQAERRKGGGRG
jgi:TP901 family phage tail tape measure protein